MDILLDMDDVLCHFVPRVLQYWNEDHPDRAKALDEITNWTISENLGEGGRDFVRSVMRYNHLYEYLEPVAGAIQGVKDLMALGHDVSIVTSVPKSATTAYDGKMQWVRNHMPFFPLDHVCAFGRKYKVRGDILLDDGLHNLEPFSKVARAVAFDRPWNKTWAGERVTSWPEFVALVGGK